MKTLRRSLLLSFAGTVSAIAPSAHAQVDIEPPMPNVMIMLDTSGSMNKEMDGDPAPGCTWNGATPVGDVRWFSLVEALTGTIPVMGCHEYDRTSGGPFNAAFGTVTPDTDYYLPFLQVLSNGCGVYPTNPNAVPANWWDFGATPFTVAPAPSASSTCTTFAQDPDGVIDIYKRQVRFGLMTFDSIVDADTGIGADSGNDAPVILNTGHEGTWSYWHDGGTRSWLTGTRPTDLGRGRPAACLVDADLEVGARGPGAPPWEGRMMGFGYEKATSAEVAAQNDRIEQVITAARPFGATPIGGMMSDLYDLVLREDAYLPSASADATRRQHLGAKADYDTLWQEGGPDGCRPFHVILITDGEPNLDLRPDCGLNDVGGNGQCPFPPVVVSGYYDGDRGPTDVARGGLFNSGVVNALYGTNRIIFHVVGLGVKEFTDPGGTDTDCEQPAYRSPSGPRCSAADRSDEERTCCILNSIADVGSGGQRSIAHYADDAQQVKNALLAVLSEVATGTATRTTSVFQAVSPTFAVSNTAAAAVGHEVRGALETVVGDGMWKGRLDRARYACVSPGVGQPPVPTLQTIDPTLGDDFADNLKKLPADRKFFTATSAASPATPWQTLRPQLPAGRNDGVGAVTAVTVAAAEADTWSTSATVRDAMAVDTSQCLARTGSGVAGTCTTRILAWYTGQAQSLTALPDRTSPLGAIFHSQPVVVGPPREFVRDEAYDVFALAQRQRPTVTYVSTVDGQLHAFMTANNTDDATASLMHVDEGSANVSTAGINNELWSFVPPIVLPHLEANLNRHALLLDGGITVRNMPEERAADLGTTTAGYLGAEYRTFLVASSGASPQIPGGGYYFALDVTSPDPVLTSGSESPKFLWQLSRGSTNDRNDALFGESVPPAAMATIFLLDREDNVRKEVPVAILAGGVTGQPSGTVVNNYVGAGAYTLGAGPNAPRTESRDWGASGRADRSITIVRVDTGEIVMRFIGQSGDTTGGITDADRIRTVGFRAPISGTPVPYPGMPGQVSTRVFVGDADGMLWAVDMSNPDPLNWQVRIAWDAYRGLTAADSAPIETVPIVSVDDDSDPVIIFATGARDDFYVNTGKNFVISLRDDPGTPGYELNWELDLELGYDSGSEAVGAPGQRVTGELNLFNGITYFSTFVPDGNSCTVGNSRIFALDYVEPDGATTDPGEPGFEFNGVAGINTADRHRDQEGTVFGVAIGQRPSCQNVGGDDELDDSFGGYNYFQSSPPGVFELVFLTGRPARSITQLNDGSAALAADQQIQRTPLTIPSPRAVTRVDSWAAIVD
jgi:type IV pilus assembly protein PilY1